MVLLAACGGTKKTESPAFHGTAVNLPEGLTLSDSGDLAAIEGKIGEGRGAEMLRLEFIGGMPSDASIQSEVANGWTKETDGALVILHRDKISKDGDTVDDLHSYIMGKEGAVMCRAVVGSGMDLGAYLDVCRTLHVR